MEKSIKFESQSFPKRLKSMLSVDSRRMLTQPLFYIMIGIAFVMPILILVMTSMMNGTVSVDPVTGEETVMQGFTNVWQTIATPSTESAGMGMDLVSMCNINLIYFLVAVLVCLFVSDDFRSGYVKNLFTVRAKKDDYVASKTIVLFIGGVSMIIAYFIGAMIGGGIVNLSFDLGTSGVSGLIMCMLSKIFLMAVFISIYLVVSIACKQRTWLSFICAFGSSMLMFAMIPMMTPLNSTIINVIMTLAGGAMFAVGLGCVSNLILKKTSLI